LNVVHDWCAGGSQGKPWLYGNPDGNLASGVNRPDSRALRRAGHQKAYEAPT